MSHSLRTTARYTLLALALTFTGCKSAADKANDAAIAQAKQQAATTGTAQQVVWTDKNGNTVTTIVQPPAPGQSVQQLTTTTATQKVSGGTTTASTTTTTSTSPVITSAPATGPAQTGISTGGSSALVSAGASTAPLANNGPVITPVDVHVPRGTTLAIRINQHISVKTSRAGDRFTGEVAHDVFVGDSNTVAIPHGAHVDGVIDASHRRGHFKGRSILELRLTSLELNGQRYALDTHDNVRTKKGKGKRSAAFIGGGTGLGMLIGGVATGGVGLVVGGLAGAGGGTLLGGLTGNRDIEIPAESVMNFKLADDLVVQPQN